MTPAPALTCARRRAGASNLSRAGASNLSRAAPVAPTSATPEPTATPLAAPPVAAKAAAAAAITAAQSVPAMDPLPEEDEHELSSTSSTSSHTGTSANCAEASSSLGPELDEDTARLAEYCKSLGETFVVLSKASSIFQVGSMASDRDNAKWFKLLVLCSAMMYVIQSSMLSPKSNVCLQVSTCDSSKRHTANGLYEVLSSLLSRCLQVVHASMQAFQCLHQG